METKKKINPKTSILAKEVAVQAMKEIRKGKKPSISKIMREKGFSDSSARSLSVKRQKSYKAIMDPFLDSLIKERDAIIKDLPEKRKRAKYGDLVYGLDKTIKNIELLEGRATERHEILSEEEKSKLDELLRKNK